MVHPTPRAFPSCEKLLRLAFNVRLNADGRCSQLFRQWLFRVSSPFTAAGPRGRFTLFPYSGGIMASTIGESSKTCQALPHPVDHDPSQDENGLMLVAVHQAMVLSASLCQFYSVRRSTIVALMCEVCQKKPVSGNNVSHANNKTRRVFNPNIQTVRAVVGKSHKRIRVCTRCLRSGLVRKAV